MNVANLENCKRLYELSWWDDDDLERFDHHIEGGSSTIDNIPKYPLGYLLRKLKSCSVMHFGNGKYGANTGGILDSLKLLIEAETPEDATCLLAIKLFEEGILGDGTK